MSLGRRNSKRDREAQLTQAMSRSIPQELDIVDKGDHLKVRRHTTRVTRKQTLMSLSLSYQWKDGRGHARPSFFWYDNDKDLKVCFLVMHVIHVVTKLTILSAFLG